MSSPRMALGPHPLPRSLGLSWPLLASGAESCRESSLPCNMSVDSKQTCWGEHIWRRISAELEERKRGLGGSAKSRLRSAEGMRAAGGAPPRPPALSPCSHRPGSQSPGGEGPGGHRKSPGSPPPPPPRIPAWSTLPLAPQPQAGVRMECLGHESLLPSWKPPRLVSEVLTLTLARHGLLPQGRALAWAPAGQPTSGAFWEPGASSGGRGLFPRRPSSTFLR